MSAELKITNLFKEFTPGKPVVNHVSFTIPAGDIAVLLGPSGCGKTTTLRCVAGLEHPTEGEIALGGEIIYAPAKGILLPPRLRNVGMVFQSYAVWPHMTVRQNVAYPLKTRGLSRAEMDTRVRDALALVDLESYADRPATMLSGGQTQRVALARAMVYQPRLLLLDEPLSNLDAQLRLRLRDELRRIIKAAGLTALYVTHEQTEAVVLGDRIGVMRDGNLLQLATPEDLYNRPADLFVAGFTGASNTIPGTVTAHTGPFGTIHTQSGASISAWLNESTPVGEPVQIAVRPENIDLFPAEDAPNRVTARILERRYQGTHTIYHLDLYGIRLEALEMGTAPRHAEGAEITIALPPTLCWAYPSGK